MDMTNTENVSQIIIQKRLRKDQIHSRQVTSNFIFSNKEYQFIKDKWISLKKTKPFVFNGNIFHVLNYKFANNSLYLSLSLSNFMEYVGTNNDEFKRLFGEDKIIRPISVGTMLITRDKQWIIGKRIRTFDYEGKYNVVAGYLDPTKDVINTKPDPFFAMQRELKEETGIHLKNIDSMICLGLVDKNQPYLSFLTMLTTTSQQLEKKYILDKEFLELENHHLSKNYLEQFILHKHKDITMHGLASLIIYYRLFYED
jgi:8-oxo-dGTP pyrophosphatase MutT (NUDIX family)